jgi:hypothetical protein
MGFFLFQRFNKPLNLSAAILIIATALSACNNSSDNPTYVVGGTVSGLQGDGLVIQNSNGDELAFNSDGAFVFSTALEDGDEYAITVASQPTAPNQTCVIMNGSGVVAGANITNIDIVCAEELTLSVQRQCDYDLASLGEFAGPNLVIEASLPISQVQLVSRVVCPNIPEGDPISYCGDDIVLGDVDFGSTNINQVLSTDFSQDILSAIQTNGSFHIRAENTNQAFSYSDSFGIQDLTCSICDLQPAKSEYLLPDEPACSTLSAEPFRDQLAILYTTVGNYSDQLVFIGCDISRTSSIPTDLSSYDGIVMHNISGRNLNINLIFDSAKPFVALTNMDNGGGSNITMSHSVPAPRSNIILSHIMQDSGGSNVDFNSGVTGDKGYFESCSSGGSNWNIDGVRSKTVLITIP